LGLLGGFRGWPIQWNMQNVVGPPLLPWQRQTFGLGAEIQSSRLRLVSSFFLVSLWSRLRAGDSLSAARCAVRECLNGKSKTGGDHCQTDDHPQRVYEPRVRGPRYPPSRRRVARPAVWIPPADRQHRRHADERRRRPVIDAVELAERDHPTRDV